MKLKQNTDGNSVPFFSSADAERLEPTEGEMLEEIQRDSADVATDEYMLLKVADELGIDLSGVRSE